jgi:tetratricopeptide (TPR) repeat protein
LVERRGGNYSASWAAFEQALRLSPRDFQILNNFANMLDSIGERNSALVLYDRALAANPAFSDARLNRALLLQRLGRSAEALQELERVNASSARFHSARASVLRDLNRLAEAAEAYDAALRLEPNRIAALNGRARVALETGARDASARYRRALTVKSDDPQLLLGLAEALEAEGREGAIEVLAGVVGRRPGWIEGQSALARMRWEAGEGRAFARGFEEAIAAAPRNGELWFAFAQSLAAVDLHHEAAETAARGRAAAGDDDKLRLLEAVHASEGGELDRATALFAQLPAAVPRPAIHYISHLIRLGDYENAAAHVEDSLSKSPDEVGLWAVAGLLWRLLNDPRRIWLHEQPGLVATRELALGAELDAIADCLRGLHTTRAHPIGQSLRGGTQTRGRLFERGEPEVIRLRDLILTAVKDYWAELPPKDPAHPLLKRRDEMPRVNGSWSVRLTDGGFHVAHIHPNGLLSSACYLVVPKGAEQEGWLEVGRPPTGLGISLEPIATIQPRPGLLALFPSTLFHGTRPFRAGERLTAAFDVAVT